MTGVAADPSCRTCRSLGERSPFTIEGELRLAARDRHAADAAVGDRRQRDRLAGGGVDHADDGAAVPVDAGDAIAAAAREGGEGDVPVGLLDVLVRAASQRVAAQARELAAVVGQVVEILRRRVERRRLELRIALVRAEMRERLGLGVPQVDVAVVGGVQLGHRHPLAVARDGVRRSARARSCRAACARRSRCRSGRCRSSAGRARWWRRRTPRRPAPSPRTRPSASRRASGRAPCRRERARRGD